MNERIRKLRKTLDLTQQEFSSRIGTTANVLTNYETGRRNPSASVINNICKTFNVNEEWLRTGEGDMFIEIPKEDEVMKYMALLLKDENDIVAKAVTGFVLEYEKLNQPNKEVIQDLLKNTLVHLTE